MRVFLLLFAALTVSGCGRSDVSSEMAASKKASPEFAELVERSMEELRIKTAGHDGLWRIGEADWAVDQDVGEIEFTNPDGMKATAPVQIIGTYNSADSTWLWSWDNPSIAPALQKEALEVKQHGEQNNLAVLTKRKFPCSVEEAWELCALACLLNESEGGYRGPAEGTFVFMTFGEVKLSQ